MDATTIHTGNGGNVHNETAGAIVENQAEQGKQLASFDLEKMNDADLQALLNGDLPKVDATRVRREVQRRAYESKAIQKAETRRGVPVAIDGKILIGAAKSYAKNHGWSVFPCMPNKRPYTAHGVKDATKDEAQVTALWKQYQRALIGVAMGAVSGVFAIDCDRHKEDADGVLEFQDLCKSHGLEIDTATLWETTPTGGRHYFFQYPQGVQVRNRAGGRRGCIGNAIDVQSDGKYVVVAPSVGENGRYVWSQNGKSPMVCPAWLLDLINREPEPLPMVAENKSPLLQSPAPVQSASRADDFTRKRVRAYADTVARALAHAGEGGRNEKLNDAAFSLGQVAGWYSGTMSEGEAWALLRGAAAACGILQADGESQALATFRSGWNAGLASPVDRLTDKMPPRESTQGGAQASMATEPQAGEVAPVEPLPLLTAKDLRKLPPLDWWLYELLPKVGVVILYGESAAGKSFVVLWLLAALAEGRRWQDVETEKPDSIVYISLESGRGVSNRVEAWENYQDEQGEGRPFPESVKFCVVDFQLVEDMDRLLASIPYNGIVVVDTLSRASANFKENDNDEMEKVLKSARRIADERESLCIIVHHTGKSGDMRGAYVLTGNVDGKVVVKKGNGRDRLIEFEKVKEAESGRVFQFGLEQVAISNDHKGRERTSCAVVEYGEYDRATAKKEKRALDRGPQGIRGATLQAFEIFSQLFTKGEGKPVHVTEWRKHFYPVCVVDVDADGKSDAERIQAETVARRQAFHRARQALLNKKLVAVNGDLYTMPSMGEVQAGRLDLVEPSEPDGGKSE